MAPLLVCLPEDSKYIRTVKRLWTVKDTIPVFGYHITKRHKVVRSYQCYAAYKIADGVAKNDWKDGRQLGGYVWHTTGSGKTMTSFKSAQLIANSKDADKVVFLMVMVYRDKDVRQQVAIREAGGGSLEEILADPASSDRYFVF